MEGEEGVRCGRLERSTAVIGSAPCAPSFGPVAHMRGCTCVSEMIWCHVARG